MKRVRTYTIGPKRKDPPRAPARIPPLHNGQELENIEEVSYLSSSQTNSLVKDDYSSSDEEDMNRSQMNIIHTTIDVQ